MDAPCGAKNTRTSGSMRISRPEPSIRRAGTTFRSPSKSRKQRQRSRFRKPKMRAHMKFGLLLATAGLFAVHASAQGRVQRPMTFEDFAAVRNVGDPQVSPDGQWVL